MSGNDLQRIEVLAEVLSGRRSEASAAAIILERNPTSEDPSGKYVEVYDFPDGRLEVRSKGLLLPYSVFSKDQRVSHTKLMNTLNG
jgi:hypothetical protein